MGGPIPNFAGTWRSPETYLRRVGDPRYIAGSLLSLSLLERSLRVAVASVRLTKSIRQSDYYDRNNVRHFMAVIDPRVTFRKVEERLETETDPVLRRNLETLLTHMKAEMAGDVDGLLVTLRDDVHYHAYGNEARMATLWPFDENGLARGEDTYTGSDGFAGIADRKLAPDDIVQYAPAG